MNEQLHKALSEYKYHVRFIEPARMTPIQKSFDDLIELFVVQLYSQYDEIKNMQEFLYLMYQQTEGQWTNKSDESKKQSKKITPKKKSSSNISSAKIKKETKPATSVKKN